MTEQDDKEPNKTRDGDPLYGLWHWSQHPLARGAFVVAILGAVLFGFTVLAQVVF